MSLLIRGGRVVDPSQDLDREADVMIEGGRIARIDRGIAGAERVIDARNRLVLPGLVDLHVHLREPGEEYKEDVASGTRAAVAGGFTTVCCMPNTRPANDTRAVTELIVNRAREVGLARVHPVAAISRGLEGKSLCEYADLKEGGAVAVSDDGRCVMDAGLMRRAMEYAATFDLPVIQHCEDHNLSARGSMHEGHVSTVIGLTAQPAQAESAIVARDLELVELTGARYHVAHLSTAGSARLVRAAKARGLPVSCEVAPHHFTLTDEACRGFDTATKVNPPLRGRDHVDAVLEAIADGTVDAIATDHAPHSELEKLVEFGLAACGISGLETGLALSLELWRREVISLPRLVALMTSSPARVVGLPAGTLRVGALADLAVVDTEESWVVDPTRFHSKGRNTPFAGQTLRGRTKTTVVGGRVVFDGTTCVGPR
ncbi:MAG: dihydroorotase [Deltaproteobacteria bacterium]|nr:dihydroorotase [Deltaproteobacteria bacterium]